jgi:hypothetical protein
MPPPSSPPYFPADLWIYNFKTTLPLFSSSLFPTWFRATNRFLDRCLPVQYRLKLLLMIVSSLKPQKFIQTRFSPFFLQLIVYNNAYFKKSSGKSLGKHSK